MPVSSSTCIDPLWTPLPQPSDPSLSYNYVTYDQISTKYFASPSYARDQLVWVLTSKGRKQKGSKARRGGKKKVNRGASASLVDKDATDDDKDDVNDKNDGGDDDDGIRTELFLRARVVSDDGCNGGGNDNNDDEPRVFVRYPKGSTYNVRRSNLIPVLESGVINERIVLVVPETPEYRRAATVHTCVGESVLEIGCDFGACVDRVRRALTEVGGVPMHPGQQLDSAVSPTAGEKNETTKDDKAICLGMDKSPESIKIAIDRFPDTLFSLGDALTEKGTAQLRTLCKQKLTGGYPNVVAIDINGNRELPAVIECIDKILTPGDDVRIGNDFGLPRLIIVKSRMLHEEVKRRQSKVFIAS